MARKRSAANIRAVADIKEEPDAPPKAVTLPPLKTESIDDDAEFLKNLNKQFNNERGMKIMPINTKMSFAQISVILKYLYISSKIVQDKCFAKREIDYRRN